ncbi:brachyurin-like [Anticarsia gemmatalis]|uniref:brachyurin-like n=1 Tax=Anticarsia gemmatalis TaxID=129554 RepID=UPI003F76CDE3
MRYLLVLFLIQSAWVHNNAEELRSWHLEVGIKHAENIYRIEQSLNSRIVGGTIAPINNHPYLAGLLIDLGFGSTSACGGSILTNTRVLTAAHCWYDGRLQARQITVVLGSPFLFHGGIRMAIRRLAVHPGYDSRTFANDIAMLHLPAQVPFNNAIQPIALPFGSLLNIDLTGQWARAAGYGRYSDLTLPTTNTVTRNVMLQVMSNAQCQSVFGDVVLDSNICTHGNGGVGICQGDSGGPLTITVHGREVLIGVSSFVARDGCELQFPSAFARVTSFMDWIRMHL